ncbi:MAG: DUF4160 domain-containing protein [Gemmatimonadetes bacterium]|nr:DUF4160 domain-containing protein [Gemmatimonadota bacterium]
MPIISRFYGIVITMYYNDHAPPHFHARYGEYTIVVEIESGLVRGEMPRRALRLVLEWADRHQHELMENWARARRRVPLEVVPPLP